VLCARDSQYPVDGLKQFRRFFFQVKVKTRQTPLEHLKSERAHDYVYELVGAEIAAKLSAVLSLYNDGEEVGYFYLDKAHHSLVDFFTVFDQTIGKHGDHEVGVVLKKEKLTFKYE